MPKGEGGADALARGQPGLGCDTRTGSILSRRRECWHPPAGSAPWQSALQGSPAACFPPAPPLTTSLTIFDASWVLPKYSHCPGATFATGCCPVSWVVVSEPRQSTNLKPCKMRAQLGAAHGFLGIRSLVGFQRHACDASRESSFLALLE